jgi:3-methyladenine DNA glycosylase AlkD
MPLTPAATETLHAITSTLGALADAGQAQGMKAYMLNQFAFLGIRAPVRRDALKALLKQPFTQAELLALAEALWAMPQREFHYTAVDLLAKQHARLDPKALPRLIKLVQRNAWWDTVDGLAGVVGDILLAARTSDTHIQRHADAWLLHKNLWVRRVALLHQLGWREQTDAERLFRYALALGGEKEFFIRKAIGWALRDYARTDPVAVTAFLDLHAQQLSNLTVREAGKHLPRAEGGAL